MMSDLLRPYENALDISDLYLQCKVESSTGKIAFEGIVTQHENRAI